VHLYTIIAGHMERFLQGYHPDTLRNLFPQD